MSSCWTAIAKTHVFTILIYDLRLLIVLGSNTAKHAPSHWRRTTTVRRRRRLRTVRHIFDPIIEAPPLCCHEQQLHKPSTCPPRQSTMLAHARLKLKNAESSIAFIQEQHTRTLEGLHQEIQKLQQKNARQLAIKHACTRSLYFPPCRSYFRVSCPGSVCFNIRYPYTLLSDSITALP